MAKGISAGRTSLSAAVYCVMLFVFALCPRLLYNHAVLDQFARLQQQDEPDTVDLRFYAENGSKGYITPDTTSYLEPATELVKGRFLEAISLERPIGYPAFLALTRLRPTAILTAQAVLLSFIPLCTFLLVLLITKNRPLSIAAGLVPCISPTGIAVGAHVLADALFSTLFAVSLVTLVYGAMCNSRPWILLSAVLSGIAVLVDCND